MPKSKEKQDAVPYEVPALVVTPDKPIAVTGNFEVVEKTLEKWAVKVSKMTLTEDNLDEVKAINKAAVALRNQLDAKVTATKKLLFNDPKAIFEARMKSLFTLIGKVESKTDEVLDKIEEGRRNDINEILNHYKEKFQEQYKLDNPFLEKIEYRKNYYNKGIEEKARKDDLEQQFKDLKKQQDARVANIRLIQASCKNEPRLNIDRYIRDLETSDVATIVEEIEAEKQRLNELDKPKTETTTASTAETVEVKTEEAKVVLGVPSNISFLTDFPGRTKKIKIQITYPCDLGDSITELFEWLKQYGIKIKSLEEVVV